MRSLTFVMLVAVCAIVTSVPANAGYFDLDWGLQSTNQRDDGSWIGVQLAPDDNLFISGFFDGGATPTHWGFSLSKYTKNGDPVWTKTETRGYFEHTVDFSLDHLGNAYVCGYADGPSGGSYHGWRDGFVRKYDGNGSLLWQDQVGSGSYEGWLGGSANADGDFFVSGHTYGTLGPGTPGPRPDTTVAKYDSAGNMQWIRQYDVGGHDSGSGWSMLSDTSGNIYLGGGVNLSQAYLMKLAPDGSRLWTREFGLAGDESIVISGFDSQGRVVFTGETYGPLAGTHHGGRDVYAGRCDPDGNIEWIGQYGTPHEDCAYTSILDSSDNLTWVGHTFGSFFGENQGGYDAYIAQIASDGTLLGGTQFGTAGNDVLSGLCTDGSKYWVSGNTTGPVWGPHAGGYDMILGQLSIHSTIPAPGALLLGVIGVGLVSRLRRIGG